MRLKIKGGKLNGQVCVPPSKSEAHRLLICAGLAKGASVISGLNKSLDILSTIDCLRALGANIEESENGLTVSGGLAKREAVLQCRESGSTLRFMLPVALAEGGTFKFIGAKRLFERPLQEYFEIFKQQSIQYELGTDYLLVSGKLKSGKFALRGDISSQYITGLLLALPLLEGDSEINITTALESESYIKLTMDVMARFGVTAEKRGSTYYIKGNQSYKGIKCAPEADFSQGAFWLVAGALGSLVSVQGLNIASLQGDRVILDILRRAGAEIKIDQKGIYVAEPAKRCVEIDASDCPDLVPVLAVLCTQLEGRSVIYNAQRLRLKESDRLAAITAELGKLGADICQREDGLEIGKSTLHGGTCQGHNDHRIAMALAIASTLLDGEITLDGAECVSKSYPEFWDHFRSIGGIAHERDLWE